MVLSTKGEAGQYLVILITTCRSDLDGARMDDSVMSESWGSSEDVILEAFVERFKACETIYNFT